MRKKKQEPQCSFSEAQVIIGDMKPKTRLSTKIFFWLFVLLSILATFLFWSVRGKELQNDKSPIGINLSLFTGILALCLAIFFAIICFIRFIRSRSIAGGLFLTTTFSTAIFLGASQLLPVLIPTTASAFSNSPEFTNNSLQLIVGLAQIGLFAIWFVFLLSTIYMHVSPVRKIDRYLQKIVDGEHVRKIRIGKAKQYRGIEEKLQIISEENSVRLEREYRRREAARARRNKKMTEL